MRKITANIIYPVASAPLKNAYLVVDNAGKIVDLVQYNRNTTEVAGLEFYNGILIPGFVNSHCHLELSHLKGKIEKGKGLSDFIGQVQKNRTETIDIIEDKIQQALRFMWYRGINGLADVANTAYGINHKYDSLILTHNFIELFNEGNKPVSEITNRAKQYSILFSNKQLPVSLAPHSIYATNNMLLKEIGKPPLDEQITTLHFLESNWELNLDTAKIINYLLSLIKYKKILLVHNLHLKKGLFELIKQQKELYKKLFWVLSPNSNLYINKQLPPVYDFYKWDMQICLGTDSLASNQQLSILDEMKTITANFAEIPFEHLLKWATLNGAKALSFENRLGSFEIGKQPGVLLIKGFDFKKSQLTQNAEVTRLI